MANKPLLRPGRPDDENTDYLPLSIKGSDIVVNESGNNSQPYPELLEFHKDLLGSGIVNEWFEYVPKSYDASRKTPVVFSMHGGLMNGWGQAVYSSWTLVAEWEGFICVFPTATERNAWKVELTEEGNKSIKKLAAVHPEFDFGEPLPPERVIDDNPDVKFVQALLERIKEKYNVDEGRVYMQGMSMGNAMTALIARNFGHLLAAAAGSGGPSDIELIFDGEGKVKNRSGSLFVWQTRPELNGMPNETGLDEYDYNRLNREYWLRINGCTTLPEIRIVGEDNLSFFRGERADLVYLDIKNRDHGQAFDEAELTWDYLFSSVRRNEDGSFERLKGVRERAGDQFAVAFSDGCAKAWFQNRPFEMNTKVITWSKSKYHGLYGDHIVRGRYLCAPLSFLAFVFGAAYHRYENGRVVKLKLPDGRSVEFAEGCIGCTIDGRVESMLCEALYRDGELLVPAAWFAASLFNMHVSECGKTIYITDHYALLSSDTSRMLAEILS